jgi:hypothetical protein
MLLVLMTLQKFALLIGHLSTRSGAGGKRNTQDISRQILVVEDCPGLRLDQTIRENPVLVIVKNSPFTSSELDLVKQ